jgi:hypothetical protein
MIKKKGQITIFVIIAILIVLAVIILLVVKGNILPGSGGQQETDPKIFFSSCIEKDLKNSIKLISSQGGYVENKLNRSFQFSEETSPTEISYLCYSQNNYLPCVNQEPMLLTHLKQEIKDEISEEVKKCFEDTMESIGKKGYSVDSEYNDFSVELSPKKVSLKIDGWLSLEKSGEIKRVEGFEVTIASRFYDLAIVAQEITNQEARFCNFEHLGYMLINPEFDIDKFRTGDSDTIYRVIHRDSKEKFVFVVRSCVIPPGF